MTLFPPDADFYPFLLEPVFKDKLWGGRMLERIVHKSLPADQKIGETWEAWQGCAVANGKHRNRPIGAILPPPPPPSPSGTAKRHFSGGAGGEGASSHFPLLFKYIDARDDLSVQVHPDDGQAQALEHYPLGKTEAWYILHAEPGAALVHGLALDVDEATVRAYLAQNRVAELLSFVPVQSGDVLFVPAGLIHAIGKGIVLAEIQQNSDITYRFYDWDRRDEQGKPRELHVEKALQVSQLSGLSDHKIPSLVAQSAGYERHYLVACRYFALEQLVVEQPCHDFALGGQFHLLSLLEGEAQITFGRSHELGVHATQGQTVLVPAPLEQYGLAPVTHPCRLLRAYVPNLLSDVIAPLRRAGHSDDVIMRLGGALAAYNDLLPLASKKETPTPRRRH